MAGKIIVHDKFKPLYTNREAFIFLITGGRGSGKSYNASTFIERLSFEAGHKMLYSRYTMKAAEISVIPEFLQKVNEDGYGGRFSTRKTDVINDFSGSQILFRGIKTASVNETANLKSIQGLTTFIGDEMEEWQSEEDYDTLRLSIRQKGIKNRVLLIMNPSNINHFVYQKYIKDTHRIEMIDGVGVQISTHPDVLHIHTTYLDNIEHLSPEFLKDVAEIKAGNPKKYAHKIIGRWQDANEEDALWKMDIISATRYQNAPPMRRIVVAIDPAVSAKDTSDETGIMVVGIGADQHLYVLEDATMKGTPTEWATKAVDLFHKWKADRVVAEVNQGGDMVEQTLRNVQNGRNIPYRGVHATKDKYTRAEPVAALWEQKRAHIVGLLPMLEYEMTTWEGRSTKPQKSPNRIDALVWGAAELMPDLASRATNLSSVASLFR